MKIAIVACAFVTLVAASGQASAPNNAPAARWNPDETLPTVDGVASAAVRAKATHCRTDECRGLVVIQRLVDIELYAEDSMMSTARLIHPPAIGKRRLRRALFDHPGLFSSVCLAGARLMSRASAKYDEGFVPTTLLTDAVVMDARDGGHCAAALTTALARSSPNASEIRWDARYVCLHGFATPDMPAPVCDALTKGLGKPTDR